DIQKQAVKDNKGTDSYGCERAGELKTHINKEEKRIRKEYRRECKEAREGEQSKRQSRLIAAETAQGESMATLDPSRNELTRLVAPLKKRLERVQEAMKNVKFQITDAWGLDVASATVKFRETTPEKLYDLAVDLVRQPKSAAQGKN
ncbi:MAG: hypothetical protein GWP08_17745, partial [Nitrospiraceae bacterium]|nr:hypothetical protein [Nitrospiraceae bacterium]